MRAALVSALAAVAAADMFDVRTYGGVGNGLTLNTAAFAKAIAAANAAYMQQGSTQLVVADQGTYLSGQIVLLSGVTLCVTPSATVLASANVSDYPSNQDEWAFVWSNGASNIGLGCGGVIDGNFQQYINGYDPVTNRFDPQGWPNCTGECRPRTVKLFNSNGITIKDVTVMNSPDWTIHIWNCSNVFMQHVTQYGDPRWPNNDGVDLDSSQNVTLLDSSFNTADDALCLKTTAGCMELANITARNVTLRSRSGAIKFGSATPMSMHDCVFEDILIWDSNRGLGIQQRDAGDIYNIVFKNITINGTRLWPYGWWGSAEPIYISSMPRDSNSTVGATYDVLYENIWAISQNAAVLSGRAPGQALRNITLRNVSITIDRLPNWNYSSSATPASAPCIDYEPTTAVAPYRVNETGWMPGFYAEAVNGLNLEGVSVAFNAAHAQSYWGNTCFNLTAAGQPAPSLANTSCVPPP